MKIVAKMVQIIAFSHCRVRHTPYIKAHEHSIRTLYLAKGARSYENRLQNTHTHNTQHTSVYINILYIQKFAFLQNSIVHFANWLSITYNVNCNRINIEVFCSARMIYQRLLCELYKQHRAERTRFIYINEVRGAVR